MLVCKTGLLSSLMQSDIFYLLPNSVCIPISPSFPAVPLPQACLKTLVKVKVFSVMGVC